MKYLPALFSKEHPISKAAFIQNYLSPLIGLKNARILPIGIVLFTEGLSYPAIIKQILENL
jgi:hypothetical protein